MTIQNIKILTFSLLLTACKQSMTKVENEGPKSTMINDGDTLAQRINIKHDTSNQYIYDIMKLMIADQKLDQSYALSVEPAQNSDISQEDATFLKTLLIEKSNPKKDSTDWSSTPITSFQLAKCLTYEDIDEMLIQKKKLSTFVWDNSRLGFSTSNDKNWYSFSRPLFSKDRKKVVMMIESHCPGLCGTGWTVVLINKNNKWTSHSSGQWIH